MNEITTSVISEQAKHEVEHGAVIGCLLFTVVIFVLSLVIIGVIASYKPNVKIWLFEKGGAWKVYAISSLIAFFMGITVN
jgi:hypothetical protein